MVQTFTFKRPSNLVLLSFFINTILATDYFAPGKLVGCYSSISGGSSQGDYQWQSSGYCLNQCGNSAYIAVKGEECICLNSLPSNQVSSSNCDTPCTGYDKENCGGDNSYSIFEQMNAAGNSNSNSYSNSNNASPSSSSNNNGASSSSNSNPSNYASTYRSSSTNNPQPTSSSDESETSSNGSAYISNSPSSTEETDQPRSTQIVVSTISQDNGSVIYSTITQSPSETSETNQATSTTSDSSATNTSNSENNDNNNNQNKSSTGAIVGGVVGGVVGAVAIAGGIFFFLRWRRNNDDDYDDEEEFYDDKYSHNGSGSGGFISRTNNSTKDSRKTNKLSSNHKNPLEMPMTNPFVDPTDDNSSSISINDFNNNNPSNIARAKTMNHNNQFVDPRVNPIMMGRRRLSEGSLIDETDYSRKVLQVTNPDRL
ncbi:unnamed protein product [Candida verbasci]|uniref:WSC domain-containing protein n=1 Tax=Candida verbasci TaxID=1227364 RepID=A0A9W4TV21_9ASCO|nr:unnamed protein product [Candida verbasci]